MDQNTEHQAERRNIFKTAIKRFKAFTQEIDQKPPNPNLKAENTLQPPQEKKLIPRRTFIEKTAKGFTALAVLPGFENIQRTLNQINEQKWQTDMNQLLQENPLQILEYADQIRQYNWSEEIILKALVHQKEPPADYKPMVRDVHDSSNLPWFHKGFEGRLFNNARACFIIENANRLIRYSPTVTNNIQEAVKDMGFFDIKYLLQQTQSLRNYAWSSDLLKTAVDTSSINRNEFISCIDYIKDYKWVEPTLKKMIEDDHNSPYQSETVLGDLFRDSTPGTKNIPWFKELIKEEALWTADNQPEQIILNSHSLYMIDNNFTEKVIIQALKLMENTGTLALSYNFNTYVKFLLPFDSVDPFIKRAVDRLKNENPDNIFRNTDILGRYPWFDGALSDAVKNDPVSALEMYKLYDSRHTLEELLANNNDPTIQSLKDSFKFLQLKYALPTNINEPYRGPRRGNRFEIGALLENIVNDHLPLEEAFNISQNRMLFFRSLLTIKNSKADHLGKISVENKLKNICLSFVQEINALHEEPDAFRFRSAENLNANELYALITYGENEIYTSSFNGLFNRMLTKLKTDDVKGDQFLDKVRHDKFRTFIRLCVQFGRLPDFLATMTAENRADLMKRFAEGLDREPDKLIQAVAVAESLALFDDPALLAQVKSVLQKEYERVEKNGDREGEMLYRLLLDKQRLPEVAKLASQALFNTDGVNIQEYFFYNDQDGQASFNHFINSYRGDRHWQIKDHGDYICLTGKKNHKTIEIYANKPQTSGDQNSLKPIDGRTAIRKALDEKKVEFPHIFVHRGHSYHTGDTTNYIPSTARFIFFGSCGGYRELEEIYQRAPQAQFFGTKGTGAMRENDVILKTLNDEILTGKDIVWKDFWEKVLRKLPRSDRITAYVPPHQNLGMLFIKTYHDGLLAKSD